MKILEYIRFRRRNSFQQNGHFRKVLLAVSTILVLMMSFINITVNADVPTYTWTSAGSYEWTVPITGIYRIEAWGGRGGNGGADNRGGTPGQGQNGRYNSIEVMLTEGTVLTAVVGNNGRNGYSWDHYTFPSEGGNGGAGLNNGRKGENGGKLTTHVGGGGGGGGGSTGIEGYINARGGNGGNGAGPYSGAAGGSGGGEGGSAQTTYSSGRLEVTQLNSPPNLVITIPSQNKYFV